MNAQTKPLSIEWVAIERLKSNTRNARRHSAKQISQIAASIREFGFRVPIIIDEECTILAGHGRWEAARECKLQKLPVIRTSDLTEEQRRAFAIADNRLNELSEWDDTLLTDELSFLFEGGFELEITGFTTADLDFSGSAERQPSEPQSDDVTLPEPTDRAITRLGDRWQIGPHRLLCGNALDVIAWEQLLGDKRADILFGDLPYNVPIQGHVSGNGRHHHREFAYASGEMTAPEFTAFLRTIFRHCTRFTKNGSIHYHCMDWRHMREILDAADGVYDQFKQLIIWKKTNAGQGAFYRSQHELVFVFKAGKARHINNFGLGEKRYRTNVVEYCGSNGFRRGRDADLEAHSTVKPTALIADFLLDCSSRGQLVVDPTVGSGSTLIAAHRTGRRGYAIEIDPLYVDTALRRLSAASNLSPVLAGDGRSFDEIAAERTSSAKD